MYYLKEKFISKVKIGDLVKVPRDISEYGSSDIVLFESDTYTVVSNNHDLFDFIVRSLDGTEIGVFIEEIHVLRNGVPDITDLNLQFLLKRILDKIREPE